MPRPRLPRPPIAALTYIAVLEPVSPGGYSVWFPDLPGCASAGPSFGEAVQNAGIALALHAEGMRLDGAQLPVPHSLEEIRHSDDGDMLDGTLPVPITVLPPGGASIRVNVTLDETLVAAIDRAAARQGSNRSAWLAGAAELRLRAEIGGR